MSHPRRHRPPLVLALALLAGCAALAPPPGHAVIDGTDWDRSEPNAAPVEIASIDGKDYLDLHRRALPAGKHRVEFITTQVHRATRTRLRVAVDLDLKPCTSYHFYAVHEHRFSPRWTLKQLTEVPLDSCTP